MTRARLVFLIVSGLLVVSILSGALLGVPAGQDSGSNDSFYKYLSVFSEVLRLVRQAYVDDTELRTLMAGALEGTGDALDPFSMYVPPAEIESYRVAREVGPKRSGLRLVKVRGTAYVMAVQEGSPAAEVGLRRGDIVAKLAGMSTRGMPLWKIQQRLAGSPGSRLELEVLHAGEARDVVLELGAFEPSQARMEDVDGARLLRIPSFDPDNSRAVGRLVGDLGDDDRLLVDLRGVAWGESEIAYDVAKLFVRGELGVLLGKEGPLKSFSNSEDVWEGRLVVLIDRGSQGPAEILARVLQQGAGAKLVGQSSFGFAGHPRFVDLEAGGSLLITDGFYTGPDRLPLDESIEPDVRVSDRRRAYSNRNEPLGDLILKRALEVLNAVQDDELDEAA